ncbi:hypothetical protein PIB30_016113 [Stylosanthes scabra]|uniref:Uncharacterized protein n=1 Tax=Stylosanthes scabra TaxID=79078 RepID=A0ABU6R7G6_9FABA|nr:hypothetical protein [Stylosanthes scabra]
MYVPLIDVEFSKDHMAFYNTRAEKIERRSHDTQASKQPKGKNNVVLNVLAVMLSKSRNPNHWYMPTSIMAGHLESITLDRNWLPSEHAARPRFSSYQPEVAVVPQQEYAS